MDSFIANSYLQSSIKVTIGSGVSVIKILSEDSYERIGGTATGGGTFWGLGKLLTKAEGFDEVCILVFRSFNGMQFDRFFTNQE